MSRAPGIDGIFCQPASSLPQELPDVAERQSVQAAVNALHARIEALEQVVILLHGRIDLHLGVHKPIVPDAPCCEWWGKYSERVSYIASNYCPNCGAKKEKP